MLIKEWTSEQETVVDLVFNRKRKMLYSRMNLDLKKKLHTGQVFCVKFLLYELETWRKKKRGRDRIEVLEM